MAGHPQSVPRRSEVPAAIRCAIPRTHRWAGATTLTQRNTTRAQDRARRASGLINAGYFSRDDYIAWPVAMPARPAADSGRPPCTGAPSSAARAGTYGARDMFASHARRLVSWLAAMPQRLGDHMFAVADIEASWRGWQVTRVHGVLGRRYRDPLFDTLRLL